MRAIDDVVKRYLAPFATSEPALSSVLAVLLNHPEGMSAFLDAVAVHDTKPHIAETVALLRSDPECDIVVEAWMANAGNIDLAIVSRRHNAILAGGPSTGLGGAQRWDE